MNYKKLQSDRQVRLLKDHPELFNYDKGNGCYKNTNYDFVLSDGENNLFKPIRKNVKHYFEDNNISWLNWDDLKTNKKLFEFFRFMIKFRKDHPAIRKHLEPAKTGLPEISCHGVRPWEPDYSDESHYMGVMFAGSYYRNKPDDIVRPGNVFHDFSVAEGGLVLSFLPGSHFTRREQAQAALKVCVHGDAHGGGVPEIAVRIFYGGTVPGSGDETARLGGEGIVRLIGEGSKR